MIFLAAGLFLLHILIGFLVLDLIWKTSSWSLFLLKASLSIGIGLGVSSLAYFLHLLFFAGNNYFIYFELLIFLSLVITHYKRGGFLLTRQGSKLSLFQIIITAMAGLVFTLSMLGLIIYVFRHQQGGWDSWMIFNRSARFIFRNQENWQDAFSKDLEVMFHADYPPMLAMNTVLGWQVLGKENIYIPILQGLLFSVACLLTLSFSLNHLKSIAQAGLGVILLWGVQNFVYDGGSQTADIPLSCFILSSVIFYYLYKHEGKSILLVFSGFCAGLAAWTKNEGLLFTLASFTSLILSGLLEKSLRRILPSFIMGLSLPLAFTLFFKMKIAPASEFLRGNIVAQLVDISRHKIIITSFFNAIINFGPHVLGGGLLLWLFIYFIFQLLNNKSQRSQYIYILSILILQLSGYYVIFLISPYDLVWHTNYSTSRLILHIYPIFVFMVLHASKPLEEIFSTNSK